MRSYGHRPRTRLSVVLGTCAAVLVLLAPAFTSRGEAAIYWANQRTDAIGRANLDGSHVDQSFITGADKPCGVAVDSNHIYWSNVGDGTVSRARLDGSAVERDFITGANKPCGVAVDSAHVYWANTGAHSIGRADLDGDGASQGFVAGPGVSDPCGVAVNSTHIYWAQAARPGTIGRANILDGSGVNPAITPDVGYPCGVAIDADYLYWGNFGALGHGTNIGRSDLAATSPNLSFIPDAGDAPSGVAVNASSIYWVNRLGDTIGRANLDGSGANPNLIVNAELPSGIAVDALSVSPADNRFAIGTLKRNKRRGTASLSVSVPGPGSLALARTSRLRGSSASAAAAGPVTLVVRPTRKGARALRRRGVLRASASLTFTPAGGHASTQARKLKLIRR